jgi:hypothetical protein
MGEYEPFDDGVEAKGAAVLSILDGVPDAFTGTAEEILADHGIEDPQPEEWYDQTAYLEAYETIVEEVGESTLRRIGESTPENAEWPPGVETPMEALESIQAAYEMNHRGGDIGVYEVERVDDSTAEVRCRNPYPCAYDRALVEGTAGMFADGYVSLSEVGSTCREDGARECVYEVSW